MLCNLVFLGLSLLGIVMGCNLPPSLWCSSHEIATRCRVREQCSPWLSHPSLANQVNFTLYMESLCPDCQEFVAKQLIPAYGLVGKIMNLNILAYGNAQEHKEGDRWVYTCQHGKDECHGNLIETCVSHLYNKSLSIPFIFCMETSDGSIDQIFNKCAVTCRLDKAKISHCVTSQRGNQWEHEAALKTAALHPPHTYVPWVTLNGVHTDAIQHAAEQDLLELICETYTGVKPTACKPL